jgi:hypothetical protein
LTTSLRKDILYKNQTMNRHTKLSKNQPFLEKLNKLVYEETFEFNHYDLNSLKYWINEIEKQDNSSKFSFEIQVKDGKCSIKYSRLEREGERPSDEVLKKILENNGFLIVNVLNGKKNESFNLKETSQQFEKFGPLKPVYGISSYPISALTTDFIFTLTSSSMPALSTNFINSLTFP